MRKGSIFAVIFAVAGLTILAGCGNEEKAANVPVTPKWQGAAYHISFDTPPAKTNPSGVTLPAIKYTANPDALEKRASIVVRFDESAAKTDKQVINQVIIAPVDISGTDGKLPADYMDLVDKNLAGLLAAYCVKGKVKVTVALTRSSLSLTADQSEIDNKRLSDWLSTDVTFKNPHPKC